VVAQWVGGRAIDARVSGRPYRLTLRGSEIVLGERTWVMGVLNVTPDSFSDGGVYAETDAAVEHGDALFEAGADIVDVGGESTRPGGAALDTETEIRRVVPVIEGLRRLGPGFISIDTTKAAVAAAALDAGADNVNDVSGFGYDPAMAALVGKRGVRAVLMPLRGGQAEMHRAPSYRDVLGEVKAELAEALERATAAGVAREQV